MKIMNCTEYTACLSESYKTIKILSTKNGAEVTRLRNLANGKELIVKKYPVPVPAYDKLKNIRHDNLPEIYDTLNLEDAQIVLEEYIDGITVADVMSMGRYKRFGVRRVIEAVCNALTVLHSRGLVHRDIKPENVMIDKNGRVVLIDFNASRKVTYAKKDTVVMGTVGYASPEQLGISQSDVRTDIYAMGVLLNVMLTGKHPSEKLARGRYGRIVRRCTDINPDNRYQSAEKLSKAI